MKMIFKILIWEVMRNLKNKQFLIGLIITPLIFALFAGAPTLLERIDSSETVIPIYLVNDQLGEIEYMQQMGENYQLEFLETDKYLEEEKEIESILREKDVDGYFVLNKELIETGKIKIYTEEHQPPGSINLENILTEIMQNYRLSLAEIEPEFVEFLTARTTVVPSLIGDVEEIEEERRPADFLLAIAMAVMLFILITGSGSMLLMSAMQEKRDRMSEILLSSISSDHLMGGKIVGHFILGIIQFVFWSLLALPIAWYFFDLDIGEFLLTPIFPLLLLFALLGFFMFAAIFVGIGATMEDMQSASNTQGMVFMIPFIPIILIGPVISNPGGIIAQVASIFPLTSPLIMIARIGLTRVPVIEIVVSALLLLLTVLFFIKLASKLFRVGMLMYGKTATPAEIWKWLRY